MTTIADFLKSIGMAEYAAGLSESGIEVSDLPSLTEKDLERLGVAPGHRNALLRAIAESRSYAEQAPPAGKDQVRGVERRHLTILFCDLVGSTAMSTRLDPEELHEIMDAYRKCCVRVIEQAGGFVAKYLGDGVLAYFGYPQASEDDAERAVNAGLALIESVGQLRDDAGAALQARVGVASGLVLIGDLIVAGAAHDHDVVGETPNLAARLQARAEPNTVVISSETRRLVGELFEYAPLDAKPLKGFATPIESWQVIKPSDIASRFRALRASNTMLIGREQETDRMVRAWDSAKAGQGCVLLISGEPGIGKSRMVEALLNWLKDEPHVRLRFFCAPNRQGSAFYPVIRQIQRAAKIKRDDPNEQRLDKLEATLRRGASDLSEAAPLIAELLSIPADGRYPTLDLPPLKRRDRTLQALMAQLEGLARQPTLMVFEDVHWIDPSSLELLNLVVDRAPKLPLLLVVTFRPEFVAPWLGRAHVSEIRLDRLSRELSAEIIANLTRDRELSRGMVDQIVERTDGVPLFIEELTKVLIEQGGDTPAREIPVTLRDMLTARLDRLGQAKEVAQIASVLGSEFSARLLSDVMEIEDDRLNSELTKLVEAEFLFEQTAPSASYRFKHALIQEAAYQSLVRSKRQRHHLKAAQTLKERFPEIAEAQPELLAHHFTNAASQEIAIPFWRAAADKAMRRSANIEAIAHLTKAQELLKALPENPERIQQELAILITLGIPLIATKGFASPEVGKVYARARAICEAVGEAPQLFPVLWGLWVFYTARAEHQAARELAAQCRRIAEVAGESSLRLLAHHAMGVTLSSLGQHASALHELDQAVNLYDREKHASLAYVYGQDSGVVCRSQAAFCLWFLGFPEQALKRNEEALALARELSHPYSLAAALDFSAWIHQLVQDRNVVERDASAAIAISSEREFVFWLLTGMILRGWALSAAGNVDEGVKQMRQGLAGYQSTGAGIMRPYYLALMARVLAATGQGDEACRLLDEAEAAVCNTGEAWYEAEICRLKGEITLQGSARSVDPERLKIAGDYFEKALLIAGQQGAKSLELRIATSFSRLWGSGGKSLEAKRQLAKVYEGFVEGFELPDLQDARAALTT